MEYLVVLSNGENVFCSTANDVKEIDKSGIQRVFHLYEVNYEEIISTGDIRDCIVRCLKGEQELKDDIVNYVSEGLGVKKADVSKVITSMKREKIIYDVVDLDGYIGIN